VSAVVLSVTATDERDLRQGLESLERRSVLSHEHRRGAPVSYRAAIVGATHGEAAARAHALRLQIAAAPRAKVRVVKGGIAVRTGAAAKVGVLFPGQSAPVTTEPGALNKLVADSPAAVAQRSLRDEAPVCRESAQLAIVAASLLGLEATETLGFRPVLALGHSLGELVALRWAGAFDDVTLLRLARHRGRAMTNEAAAGAMVAITASPPEAAVVAERAGVTVACFNSPTQHVLSGSPSQIEEALRVASDLGLRASRLRVTGAFHSPLMESAATSFASALREEGIASPTKRLVSSVTGGWIGPQLDVTAALKRQITAPVRFVDALRVAAEAADLLIDVGPGRTLARLVADTCGTPVLSLESGSHSSGAVLEVAAASWACGCRDDLCVDPRLPRWRDTP
jgi:enediyne polyketide synthase